MFFYICKNIQAQKYYLLPVSPNNKSFNIMEIIQQNIIQLQNLCNRYHVLHLYLFGSVTSNKFNTNSDIDILVDFDKVKRFDYADNFFDFKYSLQDLFHRKVDLLETKAITNPYLKSNIDRTKQLIWTKK